MQSIQKKIPGIIVCLAIAVPSWLFGKLVPVIGGPVFSILIGMIIALLWTPGAVCKAGLALHPKKFCRLLGACCWAGITAVSLLMQHVMGIW